MKHLNRQTDRDLEKHMSSLPAYTKKISSRSSVDMIAAGEPFLTVVRRKINSTLARSEEQGGATVGQPCGPERACITLYLFFNFLIFFFSGPGNRLAEAARLFDSSNPHWVATCPYACTCIYWNFASSREKKK